MHKKSIRLFISTLLLSLTVLVGGCGDASNGVEDASNSLTIKDPAPTSFNSEPSRFSSEEVVVSGDGYYHFDSSFIITDNKTGKQYLYTFHHSGYAGGASMVELGSTNDVN